MLKVEINEGGVFNWQVASVGSFSHKLNGGGVLMDTGPHTLDLLFQIFEEVNIVNSYMDSKAPAIEANCYLKLLAENKIPINVNLSRNRYLSNTARFKFEDATLLVGVSAETINVIERSGLEYKIQAQKNVNEPTWSSLVDQFYRNFLRNNSNNGVSANEYLRIARVLDEAYQKSELMPANF